MMDEEQGALEHAPAGADGAGPRAPADGQVPPASQADGSGPRAPADGQVPPASQADGSAPRAPAAGQVPPASQIPGSAGPEESAGQGEDGSPDPAQAEGSTKEQDGPDGDKPGQPGKAKSKRKHRGSFLREMPILVVIALALALIIKTYAFQAYFIPSGSMQNTLAIGDKVLVNKIVYHLRPIHRGDIVVFNGQGSWNPGPPPSTPNPFDRLYHAIIGLFGAAPGQTDYIKRVIGIPGDHVSCCDRYGRVMVNGVPLNERSYLYPGNAPSASHFSITVPPGRLWVMGDHRAVSDDSRDHVGYPGGGTIPENEVVGRAFWIVWPPSRWRVLPIPATFEQPALNKSNAAASAGKAGSATVTETAAWDTLSVPVVPTAPVLPLAVGLVGAIPLTWGQRRLRGHVRRRLARRLPGRR